MDTDFQDRYQRAEQAYGEERYSDAHTLAMGLLNQLNDTPLDTDNEAAWYGWRSFVALLLGHISLYGLEQPTEASDFYQLVLDSQPPNTQGQLAQQGLERALAAAQAAEAPTDASPEPEPVIQELAPEPEATPRPPTGELPDLLKDPFLASEAAAANPSPSPSRSTAMPWLDDGATAPEAAMDLAPPAFVTAEPEPVPEPVQEPEPKAKPEPEPEPELVAAPEPDVEPEADVETDSDPVPDPVPDPEPVTFVESELVEEPAPAASPSRPTTRDEAMKALQPYWIRVDVSQLQAVEADESGLTAATQSVSVRTELPAWVKPGQLNLNVAIERGWRAFCASPWPFVGFTLIASVASVVVPVVGNLWLITGLTRGAWMAVHGKKPTLADLLQVDLNNWWRLFVAMFVVNLVFLMIGISAGIAAAAVATIVPWLSILVVMMAMVLGASFGINQSLLPYFTTLHQLGPINAIQAGQKNIQAVRWNAFLLIVVESLMLVAGILLLFVGLFAALPVIFCVSAAAFQQIMGPMSSED